MGRGLYPGRALGPAQAAPGKAPQYYSCTMFVLSGEDFASGGPWGQPRLPQGSPPNTILLIRLYYRAKTLQSIYNPCTILAIPSKSLHNPCTIPAQSLHDSCTMSALAPAYFGQRLPLGGSLGGSPQVSWVPRSVVPRRDSGKVCALPSVPGSRINRSIDPVILRPLEIPILKSAPSSKHSRLEFGANCPSP